MEQRDGLPHECPACTNPSGSPRVESTPGESTPGESTPRGWSRRSLLRLGVAAGVGAATVKISPAFAGAVGAAEHEVDAAPVPSAAALRPAQPSWPVPPIVTRAQWGCNEALRKPGQSYNTVVEKIVVHHTVTPNNPPDP